MMPAAELSAIVERAMQCLCSVPEIGKPESFGTFRRVAGFVTYKGYKTLATGFVPHLAKSKAFRKTLSVLDAVVSSSMIMNTHPMHVEEEEILKYGLFGFTLGNLWWFTTWFAIKTFITSFPVHNNLITHHGTITHTYDTDNCFTPRSFDQLLLHPKGCLGY